MECRPGWRSWRGRWGRRSDDCEFFTADLPGEKKVLIEAKTGQNIDSAVGKQPGSYLRADGIAVGLRFDVLAAARFGRFRFENDGENPRNPGVSMDKKSPGGGG